MKNLIIIGAGNFGREVYAIARQSLGCGVEWTIKGFLDSRRSILQGLGYDVGVLDSVEDYRPEPGDVFICALGEPKAKKHYASLVIEKGGAFHTLIHPTAFLGEHTAIGAGGILCPYAVVSSHTVLEEFVTVQFHAVVGHDCRIGKWSQISPGAIISGWVTFEESVFAGSNSTCLPHSRAERDSVIGAGSVVLKRVGAGQTVFGVPARPVQFPATDR
jgi:sugar O-acyltransferase (sialic acid O-acetyltransferase NeuD family)